MNHPRDLKQRYRYMFDGENLGFGFYRGWHELLEKLCEDIDQLLGDDKRDFRWIQIKEKFGTIRLYWRMKDFAPPLRITAISSDGTVAEFKTGGPQGAATGQVLLDKISALIDCAQGATHEMCVLCGGPAKQTRFDGYVMTLCDAHAQQRRRGTLPTIWFDEAEVGDP